MHYQLQIQTSSKELKRFESTILHHFSRQQIAEKHNEHGHNDWVERLKKEILYLYPFVYSIKAK